MVLLYGGSESAQENTWSRRLAERFVQETENGSQPPTFGGETPDYSDRLAESYLQYRGEGPDIGPRQAEPGQGITQGADADSTPGLEGLARPVAQPSQPAQGGGTTDGTSQPVSTPGKVPLPPHLQWVNNPEMLSNYLNQFNAQNPRNPSNAPKQVQGVFGSMTPPPQGYYPPAGEAKDAATYWYNYMGYPDQFAMNKVSKESSGNPNAYANKSDAAGLAQVTPETAEAVGFNFFNGTGDNKQLDVAAWKAAMADPNIASLVGSMVSRKYFNLAKGDPFRAEAGYRNGFGTLDNAEREGRPWPNQGYIKKMFPGQWPRK